MSDFDLDRYFAQREGAIFGPSDEGSVYSPRTPKQEELHRARLERRAQVMEALNSKTQTLPDWEHSLARGGFLDSDNVATLTGSMVTGTGKAVEAGAQALRQANPYELSPEIVALEQQRRDGIPLTPDQQALLDQAWAPQRSGPANAPAQWGEGPGGIPAQTLEGPQDRRRGEITVQQAAERARVMRELIQKPLANQFEKSGQAIREQGQEILDHRRPEFRREQEASMPDGDLFDPRSWSLGEDPTLSGFLANVIGVTGELVPIIVAGRIGGMPSAAVVGGLQAGGGQAEEVETHLRSLGESELREGFGLYAHLRDEGATHVEALDRTITEARKAAFNTGGIIGAVGGAATDTLTRPIRNAVTQGITRNTAKAALLSAGEETVQEVAESVASRHAVNQATQGSLDLTEGTFGDAVMGAAAGGIAGAPAGFATGMGQAQEQARERVNESDSPKLTRNQQAYAKAVESGDVSEIRNPAERVRALVERASNEDLTPEVREEAATAARKERDALRDAEQQIVRTQDEAWLARAEATLEKLQGDREATTDAAARKELDADIEVIEASIQEAHDLSDENSQSSQDLARIQQRLQQANDHLSHLEQQQRDVEVEEREVQVVTGQAESTTPEEVETAVQNVITRAMMNESSLTPDQAQQIAGNAALTLSDSQRSYLQRFSEARQARHALNSAGDTHRDVMQGSPDGQYQGIQQYQQRFTEALQAGREANARQELRDIEAFSQQHRQKLEVAQQAWQRFRQDNQRSQWVYDKQNRAWAEHTGEPLSDQQLRTNGGFEVGPRSNALINEWIPAEVEALESTVAEFKSALAVRREAAQTEVSTTESAPELLQQSNNERLYEHNTGIPQNLDDSSVDQSDASLTELPKGPQQVSGASVPGVTVENAGEASTTAPEVPSGLLQQSNNESVQAATNETTSPIEAVTDQPSVPSAPVETQPSTVPAESAQTTHVPVGDATPQSEPAEGVSAPKKEVWHGVAVHTKFDGMKPGEFKRFQLTPDDPYDIGFNYISEDGKKLAGDYMDGNTGLLHFNIASEDGPASLKGKEIRKIARAILEAHPNATKLHGFRISGMRAKAGVDASVEFSIKDGRLVLDRAKPEPQEANVNLVTPDNVTAQPTPATVGAEVSANPQSEVVSEDSQATESSAETQTDGTVPEQGSQEVLSERAAKETPAPTLTVLANAVKRVGLMGTNAAYQQANLIQEYLTQKFGTVRPLAGRTDFLAWLDGNLDRAESFLKEPLTDNQRETLAAFIARAQEWNPLIEANLPSPESRKRDYWYVDLPRFLFREDGTWDDNVYTAISHAVFGWITDNGVRQEPNSDSMVNAILGREGSHPVTAKERALLMDKGVQRQVLFSRLGKQVTDALGLSAGRDVPQDIMPKLQSQMGAHAAALMVNEGLAEWATVSGRELKAAVQEETSVRMDDGGSLTFLRMVPQSQRNGAIQHQINDIVTASRGSQSVLNKLFGSEAGVRFPELAPVKFAQNAAKRQRHGLPSMLKRILNKENQRPHRLRDDMLKAVEWLSEGGNVTFLEAVVGITQEGSRYVHSSNALGIEGRNDGHRRSIDRFREFVEILQARSEGGELPAFFFDRRAWVMHRVGLHSNGFNPQQDKFHRHLMTMEGWETEVPVNPTTEAEQAIQDQFMLAVADGLGVKTDKQLNVDSLLEMVMNRLEDPVIVKGAKALQRVINGEVPEVGDKEAVVAAVKEGGQNTHSLDALMNLAHYLNAQDMNQPSFTVSMVREVDGVTNGPALAQVLLGSAESPEMLAEWAKKAGFMPVGEEATHYTAWRSRKGSRDMYETSADDMRTTVLELREQASGNPESLRVFNALAYFTGSLESSTGRNMVKTPLTALMFGSSVAKAVDSMATEFVQGIYNRLEEIANIEDTATRETASREFARRVESLSGQSVNIQDARQSLNWTLTVQGERAVRKHFNDTLGKGVKASLEYRYKEFLDRRTLYNQAANTGFKLFQATYEHRRNQLIEELMDSHDRGEEDGMPYSRTEDGKRIPRQDLTENQEIELLNELSHMVPKVNTPFSKASRERENGIYLGNRRATVGDNPAYAGEVSFKGVASATSNRKVKSIKTRSPEMRDSEPGVRALIFMIHSTDSAISAIAYEKLAALNIHDAHGLGLSQVTEGARNLNQNTYNLLAGYSPGEELTNSLNRTVAGFLQYVQENPDRAEALKPAYRKLASEVGAFLERANIAIMHDSTGVDAIGQLLNQLASEARKADEVKLDFLENTAVVDQYANEGGSYEVTDADRSRVRKIRETLAQRYRINQEMLKELAKLSAPRQFRKESTEPVSPTATARTAFGDLGTPKVAPELYLDQVLRQNTNITARDLLRVIQDQLPEESWSSGFQKRLIAALAKTLPATTRIQYVTRESAPLQDVDGKIMTNARGWSTLRPDGNTVYLKSPDFVTSGLTTELVLHELVHAALMHVVHGKPSQAARALVKDLESLRQEAKSFMEGSPLEARFAEAVKNVDELLAWGLTNKEFQDNVLRRVENPEASNRSRNRLITGMQKFIRSIHRALFGTDMAKPGDNANGLARLVENGAGLLAEAAVYQQEQGSSTTRAYQDPDPMQFTTHEVFEALRDSQRPLDGRTERLLTGVLDSIVDTLHGPFGAYKARAMELAATTAEDSFLRAVVENKAPFVSQVHNQGFDLNNQQAFVLEQVEATLKETLGSHHAARRQLSQLHRQVAAKVTARDLYAGDWNTATQQERARTEAQRAFLFETAGNERYTDTLARFAAMALVYPPLQAQLGQSYDAALPARGTLTLGEWVARIFKQLLDALSNRMARTRYGQPADDKLAALVHTLVDAEVKHRARLQRGEGITQKLEAVGKDTLHRGVERISSIAESAWVKNNGSDTVRFLGALTATVAGDRVGQFVDGLQKVRNKGFKERQGLVMSMINEMRGDRDETQVFFELQRMATRYQQQQIQVADQTSKGIVGAFREAGKHFTERRKEALTRIGVRAGLADLVDTYSMAELESLVSDTSTLDAAIAQREQPFAKRTPENSAYLTEAKELAWYMATGEVVSEHQQFNTYAIAHRAGTQESGTVDPKTADRIAQDLDILVSLYALRYSDAADRTVLSDLMREEVARDDGGNGVEYVLKITKHLQQEALERNFNNNRMMMHKGYVKEILNPHTEPVAVSPEEGKQLELEGWEFVEVLPQDKTPGMPQEPKHLYVMRDRGLRRYVTGLLSPTSLQAKGTQMHSGHSTATGMPLMQNRAKTQQVLSARQAAHRKATRNGWTYDPSKNRKVRQAPIFNELGEVSGYRYMMTAKHRDDILQRNNRVDDVLGAMASSVIDKETSVIQNKQGLEALYADYKAHYLKSPDDYLLVGPHSPDPDMREHWRLLSPETQREAVRQWGKEEMWVRKELADLVLGYRKMSISDAFERNPEVRTHMQRFFVSTMEAAFGKKVGKRLRQVEDVWQETARMIKDTVVIKNIVTLMGNEFSNISQLWLSGVPIKDIVNHKIMATKASLDYQKDSDELTQLIQQQEAGLGNAATVQRIRQLEDALQNNPVHEMVEAGLMPTIIEDVDNLDDPFSYKSRMTQWLDDRSAGLPKTVNVVARNVLMTHDTRAYRFLHKATQLSDFTARYALAQYYMNRPRDPLSKRDAFNKVTRAFVNYDVPTHRKLQYLNDMFFLPFTKYYLRIQRTILELYRDNPARVASMLLMSDYLDGTQVLLESELHHKLDSNPFNMGALELPGALGELPAIKMMGGWVQ